MKPPIFTEESVSEMAVPRFKEHKTTQIAVLLVKYSGGKIDLYKLIKLIYLIDRESLKRRGHPVTFDRPYNLPLGPTPSHTYHFDLESVGRRVLVSVFFASEKKHYQVTQ